MSRELYFFMFSPLGDSTGGIWLFEMGMGEVKELKAQIQSTVFLKSIFGPIPQKSPDITERASEINA
jgi:hypothetical protein